MKEKISLLLAGLVAGVLIGSLIPAQAHHTTDLRAVKRQLAALREKTSAMAENGQYLGPVVGEQVLSACAEGSSATWAQVTIAGLESYRWIEDCITESAKPSVKRQIRQLLKR